MTGGIYDHLLIIGALCSFIKGMTNAWLIHNLLIQHFRRFHGSPARKITHRKETFSIQTDFFASRDAEFGVPEIPD